MWTSRCRHLQLNARNNFRSIIHINHVGGLVFVFFAGVGDVCGEWVVVVVVVGREGGG